MWRNFTMRSIRIKRKKRNMRKLRDHMIDSKPPSFDHSLDDDFRVLGKIFPWSPQKLEKNVTDSPSSKMIVVHPN